MSVQDSTSEMSEQARANPNDIPLAEIDVSDSTLYEHDLHDAFFRRLREEDPVHYLADSPFGP
ncbi:cytochrome P450, partial [Pseudomonadales bacterium]|nr:cytochrome P450 [Pseudomonadales bacterium]